MEEAELSAFNINFGMKKYDLASHNLKLMMQQPTSPIVYFRAVRKGGLLVAAKHGTKKAMEYITRLEKEILEFFKYCYENGYNLSVEAIRVRTQILLYKALLLLDNDVSKPIKSVDEFDEIVCGSLSGPLSGDLDLEGRKYLLKAIIQLFKEGSLDSALSSLLFAKERYWLAGHFEGLHSCELLVPDILAMMKQDAKVRYAQP
jgi:hypothetical protein